jgi:hypothetical protein
MPKAALYHVEEAAGGVRIASKEPAEAYQAFEPADRPAVGRLPIAEWVCDRDTCPVREVTIALNLIRASQDSAKPHCPSCGAELRFNHYVQPLTLVRVTDD